MGSAISCIRAAQDHSDKTVELKSNTDRGHVLCEDCLKTYTPFTRRETLQRALVSGVAEWQGVDDEYHITRRYREYRAYLYKRDTNRDNTNTTIINMFPSVKEFNSCHEYFNRQRRKKIFATFLCFDCEKYLCAKCITGHSEHFTFSEDDKNNINQWGEIEIKIMQMFHTEGDKKEEFIKQERTGLCDTIDVSGSVSVTEWEKLISSEKDNVYEIGGEMNRDICVLKDNDTLLVINYMSTCIQLYNISSCKVIDTIELPYRPTGVTEIPASDPSQSLIALSFPGVRRIDIMNIQRRPAEVISSIRVESECYDLAYCNNKFITWYRNSLNEEWNGSIHVMNISGEIINIIDLRNLPGFKPRHFVTGCMSVHSESETIYACHGFGVTCLSFTGQVLHSIRFTDLFPRNICVDRDGRVYVMGHSLPVYRLSSDLSEKMKIIDRGATNVGLVTSIQHVKNKVYMITYGGFVHIFNVD